MMGRGLVGAIIVVVVLVSSREVGQGGRFGVAQKSPMDEEDGRGGVSEGRQPHGAA